MTRLACAAFVLLASADAAFAQTRTPAPRPRRFEISGGLVWLGGYALGTRAASLRRNEPGTTMPGGFTLFEADTSLERAFGVSARFAVAITRRLAVEAASAFSQPHIAARITADAEAEPIVLPDQRLAQFTVDGSVVWSLPGIDLGPRARPYLIGGVGYLRQIDDDRVQADTGTVGHIGGGVRYWLRGNESTRRAFGLRGEARLQIRSGGVDFEDKTRMSPSLNLLGTVAF